MKRFLHENTRRPWLMIPMAACLLFTQSAFAQIPNDDCSIFATWIQCQARLYSTGTTIRERAELRTRIKEEEKRIPDEIYRRYFEEKASVSMLDRCIEGQPERQNLLNRIQNEFYNGFVRTLEQSGAPAITRFVRLLKSKYRDQKEPLFRLAGHFKEESPTSLPAGYHRATGSIYIDFNQVSADEWKLILIHELLHALDEKIWDGMERYSKAAEVKLFAEWAERETDPGRLPSAVQNALERWLMAGLDRGLWAEYRAWKVTLVLYEEGLASGLWSTIDWMEELRDKVRGTGTGVLASSQADRGLYLLLDRSSKNPTEKIYSRVLIQRALQAIRQEYQTSNLLPAMGILGEILGPN